MWKGEKISKSHASGVVTLIFVVLFIQGVLFLFGGKDKKPEEVVKENPKTTVVSEKISSVRNEAKPDEENLEEVVIEQTFDPNLIDKSGLIKLGLSPKQAQVVINYREKGGKFRTADDFSKMYVISPKTFERLKGYISIDESHADKAVANIVQADTVITGFVPDYVEYEKRKPLRLNMADSTELVSLPGIGPYYARKIIQYRERLGGFATKEQLLEIYGIDRVRFDLFAEKIDVDTNDVTRTDLKEATFEDLSKNPYIGGYVARAIIRYRDSRGSELINLANLVMNNIIKKELYKILKYYFK